MSGIAPRLVNAPHNYDAQNEAQFRASVHRALQDTFGGINDRLASATGFPTSILGWVHNLAFSATDHDTVAWASGAITLSDGTAYAISAGNTGTMSAATYIFLDIGVSATALQISTTATDAVGANRILVAVAQNVASGKDARFQVFGGADADDLVLVTADILAADTVTANEIAANTITAAEIAAATITATQIAADTITATQIAADAVTAVEIDVANLSSVSADLGTVTAGKIDVGSIEINAGTERILFGAATAPTSGVGIFMGKDGSDYEFRAGNPSGDFIHWDGSTLTVNGTVAGTAFTGAALVFDGTGEFKAGDGKTRVKINADSTGGRVQLYYGSTPSLVSDIYAAANNFLYIDSEGPINFSGPSTASHAKPDMRWDGNQWGPRARDSDTESTNSTSWTSLHSVGWAGDSSFETGWVEFMGKANGTNNTKAIRITVNGTQVWTRSIGASNNGEFWVKMMIANNEGSTTAQRGYVVSDLPETIRTDTTYFTSSVNTGTTALTIALDAQVSNTSDSVDCDFAYAYGLAKPD